MYKQMSDILEEGTVGNFSLSKFEITSENRPFRCDIPNGKYIRLMDSQSYYNPVMSDTPMEKNTNMDFVRKAHGDVFIAGLGIGLILLAIQDKEEVKSITVLEKSSEIVELVGKQLPLNDKVQIIVGDAFEYVPTQKYDTIYFDIWPIINEDVYEEMQELKAKYRKYRQMRKINPDSFMSCWAEYQAKNGLRL